MVSDISCPPEFPFAIAGSIWLLAIMGYNLSTAVWVGIIAGGGVAAQTGIVMIIYLDESCMILTLLVLPAAYAVWRRREMRKTKNNPF